MNEDHTIWSAGWKQKGKDVIKEPCLLQSSEGHLQTTTCDLQTIDLKVVVKSAGLSDCIL